MPLANTASAAGCPLACGGRPVKPFTPIGDGMLGTAGAVMPGGVLPPANEEDTRAELVRAGNNNFMEKTADTTTVTTTRKKTQKTKNTEKWKSSQAVEQINGLFEIAPLFRKPWRKAWKTSKKLSAPAFYNSSYQIPFGSLWEYWFPGLLCLHSLMNTPFKCKLILNFSSSRDA